MAVNTRIYRLYRSTVIEAPYIFSGDEVALIPLAARYGSGWEQGYVIQQSFQNVSYRQISVIGSFQPYGMLLDEYTDDTFMIDDNVGFRVRFVGDVSAIETITRAEMIAGYNTLLVGSELMSFQTITPDETNAAIYTISNIARARGNTTRATHYPGENVWFLGRLDFTMLEDAEILPGAIRYYKMIPFRGSSDAISAAAVHSIATTGKALTPYAPCNLKANGAYTRPRYTDSGDIVLTWRPRRRDSGAGIGVINHVVGATASWEGYFRVKVYVDGSSVRTASAVDDDEWTYTAAMNAADNGVTAPNAITFAVSNYRLKGGVEYESSATQITVQKE